MLTVETKDLIYDNEGSFIKEPTDLRLPPADLGGGGSGNGVYSSDGNGTPVDQSGDKPSDVLTFGDLPQDETGGGIPGDSPGTESLSTHKKWGMILLALIIVAIIIYFAIKSTAK